MNNETMILANKVMTKLFIKGIECSYHKANTGTIYIKLDHGSIGTLRISNHKEYPHDIDKRHRYNLRFDIDKMSCYSVGNQTCYLFPIKDIDLMVSYIYMDKQNRVENFGNLGYNRYKAMMLHNAIITNKWNYFVPNKDILKGGNF